MHVILLYYITSTLNHAACSDVNKDLGLKAKAKDSDPKAKAKDLSHKAKAKD